MAVTLRLTKLGRRHDPFYRIVAIDKRKKRDTRYIESIGTYDPMAKDNEVKIDKEKLESWIKKGAEISEGLRKLLKSKKIAKA